ncbi:MAG: type I DNA topoisomerase [Candidatus Margulisbacteria bacterium]|nr:type I DNA topoisomerase [Candidatus Margulisiibacteriota bacterium]MBU1617440.1 type I DNA topoisomerase [Candidatus Margulisiibacteriota bacterium]MBU1867024.1 type I DNA topoisomerase [Candidatus Margulisiibacteriota bacterium]
MAKNLVIVESPAKARTLGKFLGKEYEVKASGGHIRDLPPKSLGVKVDHDFEPNYKIIKGKENIVKELKKDAAKAKMVYLAPDPDREGEAIAWHLNAILDVAKKTKRIEFHEITKVAVAKAIKTPREIDEARVNAQQARRVLDRLVGYKLSPLLWKKVRKGLSAGRVQSVAVRLICEREAEIKKFQAIEYWDVIAQLATEKEEEFSARLVAKGTHAVGGRPTSPEKKDNIIPSKEAVDQIMKELENASYIVKEVRKKEQNRHPAPPFITSSLQQEAARKLGFSPKKTMLLAQKLYEGEEVEGEGRVGLITYMRTDSVRISDEALKEVRLFVEDKFGGKYMPKDANHYKTKKSAQDAHEAIRPTSIARTPEKIKEALPPDEFRLYELIWKRFVACQMESAIFDQTSVDIAAGEYVFRSTGSVIKFDGFLKLYEESFDEEEEKEGRLPALTEKEELKKQEVRPEQHFTQPPARYTEASLVKELEHKGIGRPSTYAPILSTIQDRGYVEKEGRALKPTEIGVVTNGLLVKHFPEIMDITFTADMEDQLDDIIDNKIEWVDVLKKFYKPFAAALAEADIKMEKVKKEIMTDELCPKCGNKLVIRQGRYGDFYACSDYPKCTYTKDVEKPEGEGAAPEVQENCPKCGKPMVIKHGRFGSFLACSDYPTCKTTKPLLRKIGVKCPKDDGDVVMKKTRKGRIFYCCSNYPKCDYAAWQRPTAENKEETPKEGGNA